MTVWESRTTCQYVPDRIELIGLAESSNRAGATDRYYVTSYSYVCTTESIPVFYPEQSYIPPTPDVLATPSQTILDYQIGWTGKARSIAAVAGGVKGKFRVPARTTGAVVGLTTQYYESGYRDIHCAWYVANGVARVMERGEILHTYGPVTEANELRIDMTRGAARYYVDDVLAHQTNGGVEGVIHLDAALYTGGDYVDMPSISGIADGYGLLPIPVGYASEFSTSARGYGVLLPVVGAGGYALAADGVSPVTSAGFGSLLPAISIGSEGVYSSGEGILFPVIGYGGGGEVIPEISIGDGVISPVIGYGSGYTIYSGSGDGSLLPVIGLGAASAGYASGVGVSLPVVGFGKEGVAEELQVAFASTAAQRIVLVGEIRIEFDTSSRIATLLGFDGGIINATLFARAVAEAAFGISGEIQALLHQLIQVSALVPQDRVSESWVMNLENGGFTRYDSFDFSSFAKVGGSYYGCKPDGIYALDGNDDAGNPIRAMVSFGKQDFGTSTLKRINAAYVGVSSSGKLVLRVIAEGQTYDYVARDSGEHLQVQRIDTGRGLRVNQLEFELYNQDGDDFELSSVEFAVLPTARRI